jgi:hypothetical protein
MHFFKIFPLMILALSSFQSSAESINYNFAGIILGGGMPPDLNIPELDVAEDSKLLVLASISYEIEDENYAFVSRDQGGTEEAPNVKTDSTFQWRAHISFNINVLSQDGSIVYSYARDNSSPTDVAAGTSVYTTVHRGDYLKTCYGLTPNRASEGPFCDGVSISLRHNENSGNLFRQEIVEFRVYGINLLDVLNAFPHDYPIGTPAFPESFNDPRIGQSFLMIGAVEVELNESPLFRFGIYNASPLQFCSSEMQKEEYRACYNDMLNEVEQLNFHPSVKGRVHRFLNKAGK